ncbi:DUF2157 domain-containing protein [Nocardioides rotundus]|uniref:DUF2157 domain-containing protein n=1 Tax=Nocardioides rotundus TaxID=1774216 RepID=UPI001CBF45C8|nr:DUF2157 domain-containing protein [Nocardioides rotundus]UAL29503.1 DUF2157 domain-containing protein [Nocardioides rotundus]
MAAKDSGSDPGAKKEPSLELPSFRLGRKKKPQPAESAPVHPDAAPVDAVPPAPEPEPEPSPVTSQRHTERSSGSSERMTSETERGETEVLPATERREAPRSTVEADHADGADQAPPKKTPKKQRPRPALPTVSGRVAAAVTGLAVGVLAVLLTWLAQQGCDLALGTSSCGKPGFFALAAILVIAVLAGAALLRAWRVRDAGSTSLLAVGLVTVVVLAFLVESLFAWWIVIVIPLLSVAAYVASEALTSRYSSD